VKIIIVGAGEIGYHFAEWLALEKKEVTVLDTDAQALRWVTEHLDVQTYLGSGSNPQVLEEAGIKEADILLAVTNNDEVNLVSCFFANLLAPAIRKIALIRNPVFTGYQEALARGITNISMVIDPEMEVVNSILRIMSAPEVEEINDFVGGRIKMLGKILPSTSPLAGLKLLRLPELIERNRMIVAALVRDERLIIPRGTDTLRAGDLVYFVCEDKYIPEILRLFGKPAHPLKNILIIGGGNIGFRLARQLDNSRLNLKLIEKDRERCQLISGRLRRTIVLQGYATDQKFLEQENISAMDLVVAVTWDEEINILGSLLAKQLGAKKTIARVNKFPYIPLVRTIGIDHIVSPRLSAINSIFPFMRRGNVVSTVSLRGKEAEVLEAIAQEDSEIVGRPLKDCRFLKDSLILCLFRGEEVLIPGGDTVIQDQDRLIILSTAQNIPRVEQALMPAGSRPQ
jgi:trk system potassium uptake protein TrkA